MPPAVWPQRGLHGVPFTNTLVPSSRALPPSAIPSGVQISTQELGVAHVSLAQTPGQEASAATEEGSDPWLQGHVCLCGAHLHHWVRCSCDPGGHLGRAGASTWGCHAAMCCCVLKVSDDKCCGPVCAGQGRFGQSYRKEKQASFLLTGDRTCVSEK